MFFLKRVEVRLPAAAAAGAAVQLGACIAGWERREVIWGPNSSPGPLSLCLSIFQTARHMDTLWRLEA